MSTVICKWVDESATFEDYYLQCHMLVFNVDKGRIWSLFLNQRKDGTWYMDIFKDVHTKHDVFPADLEEAKALAVVLCHMDN